VIDCAKSARRENGGAMADSRPLAIAALALGLACAGGPAPRCELASEAAPGRFAQVEVTVVGDAASLGAESTARLAGLVRQSARDWLEQRDRLAPDGELTLQVTVDVARLRSSTVTWLFSWAVPPDQLAAQVAVRRGEERTSRCPARVESALAGYSWRDPDPRLERLARRLGHRVAEGL
jgi:hypothetical protein